MDTIVALAVLYLLGAAILIVFTIQLARWSYKKGWDKGRAEVKKRSGIDLPEEPPRWM